MSPHTLLNSQQAFRDALYTHEFVRWGAGGDMGRSFLSFSCLWLKKKTNTQTLKKNHFWTSSHGVGYFRDYCYFLFEEVIKKLLLCTLKTKPQLAALTALFPWNGISGGRRRRAMPLGDRKQQRWAWTHCQGTSLGSGLGTEGQHMKRKGPALLQRNDLKQRQKLCQALTEPLF